LSRIPDACCVVPPVVGCLEHTLELEALQDSSQYAARHISGPLLTHKKCT
jgi:hypothetical protein